MKMAVAESPLITFRPEKEREREREKREWEVSRGLLSDGAAATSDLVLVWQRRLLKIIANARGGQKYVKQVT